MILAGIQAQGHAGPDKEEYEQSAHPSRKVSEMIKWLLPPNGDLRLVGTVTLADHLPNRSPHRAHHFSSITDYFWLGQS